jgi:hypothetical protein
LITTCRLDDNTEVENGEEGGNLENGFYWQGTVYSEKFSAFSNDTYNSSQLSNLLFGDLRSPSFNFLLLLPYLTLCTVQ